MGTKRWALLVKQRAGWACERCGKPVHGHQANAHHKDHDQTNNILENGECLCVACHKKEHPKSEELIEKFRKMAMGPRSEQWRQRIGEARRRY